MGDLVCADRTDLPGRECDDSHRVAAEGYELDGVPLTFLMHHNNRADIARLESTLRHIRRQYNTCQFLNHRSFLSAGRRSQGGECSRACSRLGSFTACPAAPVALLICPKLLPL